MKEFYSANHVLINMDSTTKGRLNLQFTFGGERKYVLLDTEHLEYLKSAINEVVSPSASDNNGKGEICPVTKKQCDRAKVKIVCESAYGTCEHQAKLLPVS